MIRDAAMAADRIELVETALAHVNDRLEQLGEPGSAGYELRSEQLEEAIKLGESTAHQVDGQLDMGAFKSWYERTEPPAKMLRPYARLLARRRL